MESREFFLYIIAPFLLSLLIQLSAIRLARSFSFCLDNSESDKPQRFHKVPTPRSGGMGIFIASALGLALLDRDGLAFLAAGAPAFAAGFYEDLRSDISPRLRLLVIGVGSVLAIILLNSIVFDIGIARLPLWLAVPFTILALTGLPNAFNIIDGLNGLSAGMAVLCFVPFAVLSYIYQDPLLLRVNCVLIASAAGFLVWNFPKGKIFLGDGGAYFLGFILAVIAVLMTGRHPEVSPWFPVAVFAYPVFEVIFSIYRRKIKRGLSPFEPDSSHLHSLIYRRRTRSNPGTSARLWLFVTGFNALVLPFHKNTAALIIMSLGFAMIYVMMYRRIVRFSG